MTNNPFFIIIIVAIFTFITRAVPFAIFGGKKEVPAYITYLGKALPPAVMSILIVYCLKNVDITSGSRGIPEFISIAVVIILHRWKRSNLLSIGTGTILYMVLIQNVFV
ncbi:branched-chain amino acid transporter AzlD [Tyzzerella sp. An114]|uniref:branched-chain amino acid transporter permease n=1 Tax=Tyzzerella sp. An114 TaxID=1965545 RepID=UPI000B4312E5|nr:branched-chain amino acid transporter permease [Tyzzerella sp. An114]OUQ60616.1 branched-chain amino acid transporter AzlD [Tyzzerella sp. An114]